MDYYGRRLLLTVAHPTHTGPPLARSVRWDPEKRRVKLWRLGALNFLARGQLNTGMALEEMSVSEVDFAYVDLPPDVEPRLRRSTARPETSLNPDRARSGQPLLYQSLKPTFNTASPDTPNTAWKHIV